MVEPIGVTLTALALVDPWIKACRKAYGLYKLTRNFGAHYVAIQRRLDGEKARLETAVETQLRCTPDESVIASINEQLANMKDHFQACQDMVVTIDGQKAVRKNPAATAAQSDLHTTRESVKTAVGAPSLMKRMFLRPKASISSKKSASLASSSSLTPSGSTSATSQGTVTTSSMLSESLQSSEVQIAANRQALESKQLQDEATFTIKAKWLTQRGAFISHLDEIQASNDLIRDLVMMRALNDIHKAQVLSTFQGRIPDDVVQVQDSLQRLHRALARSNRSSPSEKALEISIRIQEVAGYVQMQKKLVLLYDYMDLREGSAVYTLQFHPASAVPTSSTMILAETMMTEPRSSAGRIESSTDVVLSHRLCDVEPDADESIKDIGSILTPRTPNSIPDSWHQLFQDISSSWEIQSTVAELIQNSTKYRTYINLAVQIALSYMYFVSIGTSHTYPRLSNYRYYRAVQEEEKALQPDSILMPYLSIGFGSKAPKRSTYDIGGPASYTLFQNEGITRLGILLHQVGCWTTIEEQDLSTARETARSKRNELMHNAGMPYTQVVDLCFASRDRDHEPQAQAELIYRGVVVPLQTIVNELIWD